MYSPLVKKDGLIAFHDIFPIAAAGYEVSRYWDEIKHEYEHTEIVNDWNQG